MPPYNDRGEPMRLDEGLNVIGKRVNREPGRIPGFRFSMATRFNCDSTETWVSGEGFGRLSGVSAQSMLENNRHSIVVSF
jgi:hypothetical protein